MKLQTQVECAAEAAEAGATVEEIKITILQFCRSTLLLLFFFFLSFVRCAAVVVVVAVVATVRVDSATSATFIVPTSLLPY